VLGARLTDRPQERDPHYYGFGQQASNRLSTNLTRPRDVGAQGEQWRNILLDQFRRRGANFFQL
jgi:hypothetical protein